MTLPFQEVVYYLGPVNSERTRSLESQTRSLRWGSFGSLSLGSVTEAGVFYIFETRGDGKWTGPLEPRDRRAPINQWLGMFKMTVGQETHPDLPLTFGCAHCDRHLNRIVLRKGDYWVPDSAIPTSCPCGQGF